MGKRKDEQQIELLNCGDALELAKFKKRTKLKAVKVFSSKERKAVLFDNRINLISVEESAVIFRIAPQTIRNWIAHGKIPYIQIGRRYLFQRSSLQQWLNQKEIPQWR